jgi:hypothetical protein
MSGQFDETGFTDNRGVSDFSARERRPLDLPSDEEELADLIVKRPVFPGLMLAVAVLWMVGGAVCLALFALARALRVPFQGSEWLLILGALFYIMDGIQLILGKSRDPLQNGVISVLVGLFLIGLSYYQFDQAGSVVSLVFSIFFGALFLTPGILVFLGRKRYLEWKAERER